MKRTILLISAFAVLAAAPAGAQDNAVSSPADNAANAVTTVDVNATNMAVPADVAEPAALPPAEPEVATAAARYDDRDDGFPWGLIGLVGLVGLLGRRRAG